MNHAQNLAAAESWAALGIVGMMFFAAIFVTVLVLGAFVAGIRRVANLPVGPGKVTFQICQNHDCGGSSPLTAVYCRRCGGRLNATTADAPRAISA